MPGRKGGASKTEARGPEQPGVDLSKRRLVTLATSGTDSSDTCRTFVFKEEGHTLGNALKNVILRNPKVSFCGYSIPHPAEDQMLLRIQTVKGYAAQDALRRGLLDLKTMCNVTKEKFTQAMEEANL